VFERSTPIAPLDDVGHKNALNDKGEPVI